MPYDRARHPHHSIRLRGYDYTGAGAYFVTICAWQNQHLFGSIINGAMHLNDVGRIVADEWQRTAVVRSNVIVDAFVVMPNHMHGVLILTNADPDGPG
jgi:putative transposase